MLKKVTAMAVLLSASLFANAQGTVNFETSILGTAARIYDVDRTTPLAGTGYWVQLFAADGINASESALTAKGIAVNFRGGLNAGYVQVSGTTAAGATVNKVVTVTQVQGGPVTYQIRAWAGNFSTYDAAVAGGAVMGKSDLFNLASTGFPPATPPNLANFVGFSLVPEPSTIALGVLGLGSLLLFRRRK